MAYCRNCGSELVTNAKFCQKCGYPTKIKNIENNQRQQEFSGKVFKCPNCGEVLKSFEINCPTCGYELREVKPSSAVEKFALKLEAIESRREFASAETPERISITDEQKINLIKSFVVPNSKEDMLEFMILATSSMNMRTYDSSNTDISKSEKEVNDAWFSKVEQVYEKAKRSYSTDNTFIEIEKLYDKCMENIHKSRKKGIIKRVLMLGWMPLIWIIIFVLLDIYSPKWEAEENERLENIVLQVQEAMNNGEYKHALRLADSMECQRDDTEMQRYWTVQKAYWIDEVLEGAAENGVELDYVPSEDIDEENDTSEKYMDEIKANVDEFKRIMSGEESDIK